MKLVKAQVRNDPLLNVRGWSHSEYPQKFWMRVEREIRGQIWDQIWSIVWDELDGYNKGGTIIL